MPFHSVVTKPIYMKNLSISLVTYDGGDTRLVKYPMQYFIIFFVHLYKKHECQGKRLKEKSALVVFMNREHKVPRKTQVQECCFMIGH